jgi:CDP-diacylglycerol--glycerol-3-phosphate 3-phosphatidyltransferase
VARAAVSIGVTPNAITLLGAIGVIASASWFYPREEFFWGTILIVFFALSDLFDGAMARISQKGASLWGGFLDSTIDRVTDSAITIAVIVPLIAADDPLSYLGLATLVTGFLTPYILTAVGFHGLGVPYILAIGLWLLAILGFITVIQRMVVVRRGLASR